MAPTKFGLFKGRSRDQGDQPSSDHTPPYQSEHVSTLDSPVPSTSKGIISQELNPADIFPMLDLDDDDEEFTGIPSSRRNSFGANLEEQQVLYQSFQDESTSAIDELNQIQIYDEPEVFEDEASTTYDANSLQFDEASVTEENSTYCAVLKKPKKSKSKEQELKDLNMWQATNYEVMSNLLNRSGTKDEKIKWQAIATARGLCTLTDNCTCNDCKGSYLVGVSDGDAGLGAAPLFSTMHLGCSIQ
ncbi:unnamed protein product [Danaus chrysippus]|uniref:(African queen) hypothetical protein n=1 Tax=Danaus chrysippus TaxID=151541 RepID=A0A8J2W750_9NEOP|nr:unnamed protein product [Danaus chrysippus]